MSVIEILQGMYFFLLGSISTTPGGQDFTFTEYDKLYHLTNSLQCEIVNATDPFQANYTSSIQANMRRLVTPLVDCPQNICNATAITRMVKHNDVLQQYKDTLDNITTSYTSTRVPTAESIDAVQDTIDHLQTILGRVGSSGATYTPVFFTTTMSTPIQFISQSDFFQLQDLLVRDQVLFEFLLSLLRYQNEINLDIIKFSGCRQIYNCGCSVLQLCRLDYQSCI
ncbi:uncharacterized protein LOC117105670 [Anneissia japonica]|uniref:uncharacterized protein LOC117105670 n=1 Tax=Anneissia japonica TaxID=1529436 RepID=UPI0014255D30|nr:uncharacterized protein LOC117105670 [Anneissia japonica]